MWKFLDLNFISWIYPKIQIQMSPINPPINVPLHLSLISSHNQIILPLWFWGEMWYFGRSVWMIEEGWNFECSIFLPIVIAILVENCKTKLYCCKWDILVILGIRRQAPYWLKILWNSDRSAVLITLLPNAAQTSHTSKMLELIVMKAHFLLIFRTSDFGPIKEIYTQVFQDIVI